MPNPGRARLQAPRVSTIFVSDPVAIDSGSGAPGGDWVIIVPSFGVPPGKSPRLIFDGEEIYLEPSGQPPGKSWKFRIAAAGPKQLSGLSSARSIVISEMRGERCVRSYLIRRIAVNPAGRFEF
jgi:hypothetical protein